MYVGGGGGLVGGVGLMGGGGWGGGREVGVGLRNGYLECRYVRRLGWSGK